jgi:hypothetical protein
MSCDRPGHIHRIEKEAARAGKSLRGFHPEEPIFDWISRKKDESPLGGTGANLFVI